MIRISATQLEAFRRWLDNEDATIEEMVAYLEKKVQPNEAMLAGSAFHKILEDYEDMTLAFVERDGFKFDFTEIETEIHIPKIKEFKFEIIKNVNGEVVTFVGVVDAMESNCVFDHKLTAYIDAENYSDSMQWRCYLLWLGVSKFTYNLFQKYTPSAEPDKCIIKSVTQISFYRYPGMEDDVISLTIQLIEFIKENAPHLITNS